MRYFTVCERRAIDEQVCLVRQRDVAGVATGPGQKSLILAAADRLACAEDTHAPKVLVPSDDRVAPAGDGQAYLVRGIFLQEVNAGYGNLDLVGPAAAEIPLRTGQDGPGFAIDE